MSDLNPATQWNDRKRADSILDSVGGSSVTGDTVDDKDYDVLNSYNFVLRVEGFQNLPLKAVRGINKQNEYEYIQEGGLNDYVHMVRKPISQPFTFQVERYVSQDWLEDAIDPLANGTELILPLMLYMYRSNAHDGTSPSRYYVFTNCRVTGVQIGDLDAEKSGLHTITNTIAYAQMTIVTVPFAGIDEEGMYQFNLDNAENLTNTPHVRTLKDMGITKMTKLDPNSDKGPDETDAQFNKRNAEMDYRGNRSKEDMKTLSNKYQFNVGEKGNTKNLENTVVQENDEADIRKYEFSDDGVHPNNENTDSVAEPEMTPFSKELMEMRAAEDRYEFATDKNKNKKHTNNANVEAPTAKQKKDMETVAKGNKYKFKSGRNANAKNLKAQPAEAQLSKDDMKGKAKKYNFKSKRNKSAAQDEFEVNKMAMKAKAEMYNKQSHYAEQENEPAEIRNDYRFGDGPSDNVQLQSNEAARSQMEGKAKKYPKTRSARDVSEFLNRK